MTHVATVMTPREAQRLGPEDIKALAGGLAGSGSRPLDHFWLSEGRAFDLFFEGNPPKAVDLLKMAGLQGRPVDCIIQAVKTRPKKLFVADMDSTIIAQECIDEIAAELGLREKIAPITEAAMRGKLDFKAALKERVALLKGLDRAALKKVLDTRIDFNPGAETLIPTLKKHGLTTGLVSGGFTFFTGPLSQKLGFDLVLSNELLFEGEKLTGKVGEPIVDAMGKKKFLETTAARLGAGKAETLALGDGANDIPMFESAGLSLAYHAKPVAEEAAGGCLRYSDLTGVLFALGIPEDHFAK